MNMIYNSPYFCVVEFPAFGEQGDPAAGGFEIMDKNLRREIFLGGKDAEQFRTSVKQLIAHDHTADDVDEFLAGYAGLMTTPLTLH